MTMLVPPIEENIPLPENAKEAFPDLTAEQELQMRANVITLMSDLTGQELAPTQENADEAKSIAKEMMSNPQYRPDYAKYPNETLAMLAGMVAQMNVSIVEELSDLKMYVVNKLVAEVENAKDPKVRVAALSKLGEIDGVDAFKKRTEVTHKHMSIEEVESELLQTLSVIEGQVIDVEARAVVNQAKNDNTETDS
jgi:undecaprenyl pyrophosphate synthase